MEKSISFDGDYFFFNILFGYQNNNHKEKR